MQLAISRKREYLADSSAIELTRNPEGLKSALIKLTSDKEELEAANKSTATSARRGCDSRSRFDSRASAYN